MSSRETVLSTYELLEMIIVHLPPTDIRRTQLVAMAWRIVVSRSTLLAKLRCLQPTFELVDSRMSSYTSELAMNWNLDHSSSYMPRRDDVTSPCIVHHIDITNPAAPTWSIKKQYISVPRIPVVWVLMRECRPRSLTVLTDYYFRVEGCITLRDLMRIRDDLARHISGGVVMLETDDKMRCSVRFAGMEGGQGKSGPDWERERGRRSFSRCVEVRMQIGGGRECRLRRRRCDPPGGSSTHGVDLDRLLQFFDVVNGQIDTSPPIEDLLHPVWPFTPLVRIEL